MRRSFNSSSSEESSGPKVRVLVTFDGCLMSLSERCNISSWYYSFVMLNMSELHDWMHPQESIPKCCFPQRQIGCILATLAFIPNSMFLKQNEWYMIRIQFWSSPYPVFVLSAREKNWDAFPRRPKFELQRMHLSSLYHVSPWIALMGQLYPSSPTESGVQRTDENSLTF